MLIVYFGKSAAGKDTLMRQKVAEGLKPCVSMTTRPMRDGEQEGIDYYFVSKEEFFRKMESHDLVEYRSYNTLVNGIPDIWYYGTPVIDINDNYVAVADIGGVRELIKFYGADNVEPIYVTADNDVRRKRAEKRGSFDETEWNRRLADDEIKFSESEVQSVADLMGKPVEVINNNQDRT